MNSPPQNKTNEDVTFRFTAVVTGYFDLPDDLVSAFRADPEAVAQGHSR